LHHEGLLDGWTDAVDGDSTPGGIEADRRRGRIFRNRPARAVSLSRDSVRNPSLSRDRIRAKRADCCCCPGSG